MKTDKCSFCGTSDDELLDLSDGSVICEECLDGGALPRRSDSHVLKMTGYVVERS